jgi:hypothetical protein
MSNVKAFVASGISGHDSHGETGWRRMMFMMMIMMMEEANMKIYT